MKLGAVCNKLILNVSHMDLFIHLDPKYALAVCFMEINYSIGAQLSNFVMKIYIYPDLDLAASL